MADALMSVIRPNQSINPVSNWINCAEIELELIGSFSRFLTLKVAAQSQGS